MQQTYSEWFEFITLSGWYCELYHPIEILANYLSTWDMTHPIDEPYPVEYIKQYMFDVTRAHTLNNELELSDCINYFNNYYKDHFVKIDFKFYLGIH